MSSELTEQVLRIKKGDHLCLFYDKDPAEQLPALVPFIQAALAGNEQFVYIADDQTSDELNQRLRDSGIDVDEAVQKNRLKLWTRKEWRQPGEPSSQKKLQQVQEVIQQALAAGFDGVRFAVEMTWILGAEIDPDQLEHWEATLNTIFVPGAPGRIICQYNGSRLSPEAMLAALHTHPLAILGKEVCSNPFYEGPLILGEDGQRRRQSRHRLDWMIDQVLRGRAAERERHRALGEVERKRSDDAVREAAIANRRLAAIVESSDDAIISKDLQGTIMSWNLGAERIFGYKAEEVIGKSITLLIPRERLSEEDEVLSRLRRGERIDHYDTVRQGKDGTRLHISLTVSPIRDDRGVIVGASKVARDVTQRKRSEQRLALQNAVNGILADCQSVNEASAQILKAVCQNAVWDLGFLWQIDSDQGRLACRDQWPPHPSELSALAEAIRHTTFPPGEGLPGKVWSTREPAWVADVLNDPAFPKGPLGPAQGVRTALGFPIIAQNRVTAVMEFFSRDLRRVDRDLLQMLQGAGVQIGQFSERRAAEAAVRAKEEALRQAQEALRSYAGDLEVKVRERTAKLQETIGELEAFSYSVSHDMRAPLRAMQGFSDALLRDYSLSLDEQGKDYLSRIHRAAQRLDLLIRDVLTYSRIAKEDLLLRPVELDRFLNDVVQSYPEIQTFQSFIEVSKPLGTVFAHEAFLSQVISNLLGNALKFVAPGVPPRIRLWTEPVGDMLRLNVADNGLGIAPEHQHRIFQIFGRVYADKRFQGTGIGLAIVKKAVERMGGQVGVESNLGQGSRFWFTLRNAR